MVPIMPCPLKIKCLSPDLQRFPTSHFPTPSASKAQMFADPDVPTLSFRITGLVSMTPALGSLSRGMSTTAASVTVVPWPLPPRRDTQLAASALPHWETSRGENSNGRYCSRLSMQGKQFFFSLRLQSGLRLSSSPPCWLTEWETATRLLRMRMLCQPPLPLPLPPSSLIGISPLSLSLPLSVKPLPHTTLPSSLSSPPFPTSGFCLWSA